jgi:hypothetical protein
MAWPARAGDGLPPGHTPAAVTLADRKGYLVAAAKVTARPADVRAEIYKNSA